MKDPNLGDSQDTGHLDGGFFIPPLPPFPQEHLARSANLDEAPFAGLSPEADTLNAGTDTNATYEDMGFASAQRHRGDPERYPLAVEPMVDQLRGEGSPQARRLLADLAARTKEHADLSAKLGPLETALETAQQELSTKRSEAAKLARQPRGLKEAEKTSGPVFVAMSLLLVACGAFLFNIHAGMSLRIFGGGQALGGGSHSITQLFQPVVNFQGIWRAVQGGQIGILAYPSLMLTAAILIHYALKRRAWMWVVLLVVAVIGADAYSAVTIAHQNFNISRLVSENPGTWSIGHALADPESGYILLCSTLSLLFFSVLAHAWDKVWTLRRHKSSEYEAVMADAHARVAAVADYRRRLQEIHATIRQLEMQMQMLEQQHQRTPMDAHEIHLRIRAFQRGWVRYIRDTVKDRRQQTVSVWAIENWTDSFIRSFISNRALAHTLR